MLRRVLLAFTTFALLLGVGGLEPPQLADAARVGPGGAPPAGSGTKTVSGPVRVIDGDTIDVWIDGQESGIGLIGINAQRGNSQCGAIAIGKMYSLVKGGLRFEEDANLTFDSRGRRMYRAFTSDGRPLSDELVKAGVAKPAAHKDKDTGRTHAGKDQDQLLASESQAIAAGANCAGKIQPSTRDADEISSSAVEPNASAAAESPLGAVRDISARTLSDTAASIADALRSDNLLRPGTADAAMTLPTGFTEELIAQIDTVKDGQPTNFAFLPDGRMLITLKNGTVKVLKNGALLPAPFIDLRDRVNDYWDHGLLGITIDPNFATNGYVYLAYTYENDPSNYAGTKTGRVARYTAIGDTASPATETVLLGKSVGYTCDDFPVGTDCIPSESPSHSVGNLKFAPDGTLFVSLGDGAHFNFVDTHAYRTQNLDSLSGKMLHITTTGAGVPGNPFWTGNANDNRSKVWAYGLRNSFRFSLRPGNTVPFLGDVGWNTWEKISAVPARANLGWPCYEGFVRQAGYEPNAVCQTLYGQGAGAVNFPLTAWTHNNGSSAAMGGIFYTGTTYPAAYQGSYFYGDYGQSWFHTMQIDANNQMVANSDQVFGTGADNQVSMDMGSDGNIYYTSIGTGQIRRIRYTVGNTPPTAVATANPTAGSLPLAVQFTSAGANDPDGDPLTYSWDFGDGTPPSTAANPSHAYTTKGVYSATLTVSDGRGGTGTATAQVGAGVLPPVPTISTPISTLRYKVGDTITFSGSATDPQDGTILAANLTWQINLRHCPFGQCHTHPFSTAVGSGGSFVIPDHGDDSYFDIVLNAQNSAGLRAATTTSIHPQNIDITLATSPSWQRIVYDGDAGLSPLTRTTIVGSQHTIYASSPQNGAVFTNWSDSGAQQHNVTMGATNATLSAKFNLTPHALSLNGTTAYGETPGRLEINPTGDWTVETWFKDETPGGFNHAPSFMVIKDDTAVEGEVPYQMWIEWGNLYVGQKAAWNQQVVFYQLNGVDPSLWHHAAATMNSSTRTLTLYLDGVQVKQVALTALSKGNKGPLRLGMSGGTAFWRGKLDDLRIWNVVRAPADILASFNRQLNGVPTGLAGYWPFDEGTGAIASTSAGEQKDITFNGGALWALDAPGVPDTWSPVVSAIQATNLSSSAATITWSTDELSDSQVEYGATTAYGSSTAPNTNMTVNHSVQIAGVQPSSTYHFRVKSKDAANNLASSTDFTFTTTAPQTCPCTIWPSSAAPAVSSGTDASTVELGVKFRSDTTGYITGIRFYKGTANTGTHIGSLWTSSGTRLAQATFAGETASGWQQVTFPSAVAINANTTYVASYFAPAGGYASTLGTYAGAGVENAPLHALADGADGGNGLYVYSATSTFPTNTFQSSNYWVDVVFTTTAPVPDTTPPTITAVQSTGIGSTEAAVTWTTDKVADSQVEYGTTATYGTSTTVDPTLATSHSMSLGVLQASTTYHYRVKSKSAGGVLATSADFTFTTAAPPPPPTCPCSIWTGTATPGTTSVTDASAVELGVKFKSDVAGYITGIRFYKGAANTGTHIGSLWSNTGTRLAQATFSGESATGWQQVTFPGAVPISANTTYVASYFAPQGGYARDLSFFGIGLDNASLHALADSVAGGNGTYGYSTASAFPNNSFQASNYWVDVLFTTTAPAPDTTPPSVTAVQAGGVTASGATITWTTNELADSMVEYGTTTAYGSATPLASALVLSHSVTLSGLQASTIYHYRVKSKDASNNLATSADFSFTSAAPPACPCSIWTTSAIPNTASSTDTGQVELGLKFRSDVSGYIKGIRFYKGPQNTGTHVVSLWSSTGSRLAQATASGETASGWQTVTFATSVAVTANTTYVVSYNAPVGGYSVSRDYFTTTGTDNGTLHALSSSAAGGNGVYNYGPAGTFPNNTFQGTNYWVDILFSGTP